MVEPTQTREMARHKQMLDAQAGCVPCKLCGGQAVISDAGPGAGYYIACSNRRFLRKYTGCLIDEQRLSGWAYNVRDWWNRLHAPDPAAALRPSEAVLREALIQCRDQFAFYAREHTAAGKHEKAATNQRFADLVEAALAPERSAVDAPAEGEGK